MRLVHLVQNLQVEFESLYKLNLKDPTYREKSLVLVVIQPLGFLLNFDLPFLF